MRLELVSGTSKKFWEATQDGRVVEVRWGRLGTTGQRKVHRLATARAASIALDQLVAAKQQKGYRRVDTESTPTRDAALEAAMLDARDDVAPALVYADWLQAAGNPWGELISVQHAREQRPKDKTLQARERALASALPRPDPELATITWRRGLIDTLHLFNERDWMDESYDVFTQLRPLLALPMSVGLRELRTGVIRWDSNSTDVPAVLAEVAGHPCAPRLERLFLGDIPDDVDMDHHVIGDVRALSKQFPNLKWLKLHSGGATWSGSGNFEFGPLKLPKLETLIIETCAMSRGRLKQVLGSTLPALKTLELWFGSADYSADATLKDLRPLLDGVFPGVTSLGLRNEEFSDALAAALVKAKLAPRLERLDLSLGVLGGQGVQALVAGADAFKALTWLDVSRTFVGAADVRALKKAFPRVTVVAKELKELDETEARYCSVHE
jgi:uncharacterized protein (TIGR02996 family)